MSFINTDFIHKYVKEKKLTKTQANELTKMSFNELSEKLTLEDLKFLKDLFGISEIVNTYILDFLVKKCIKGEEK